MNKPVFLAVLATSLTSAFSAAAQGQPWLEDRRYREGIGIRVGDLELHPGIAAEGGYDSNYWQASGDGNEEVIPTARLRVTPSFSVATLGPQRRDAGGGGTSKVDFRATASGTYNEIIALESEHSDKASDERNFSGQAGFKLRILPGQTWGGDLLADFQRMVEPTTDPNERVAFDRDTFRAGAGIIWQPQGGLFESRLGYEFRYNHFEDSNFRSLDNVHHYIKGSERWRFLPRSALVFDGSIGFIRYIDDDNLTLNDSKTVRAKAGFNGLITNHFALLALAGWGASFYDEDESPSVGDFDSILAHTELKWFILPQPRLPDAGATVGLSSVAVGYTRNFSDSYLTDFYWRDRGYLNFSYFFAGVFLLNVEGGVSHISYPESYFPDDSLRKVAFGENRVDAEVFGEYRLSDTFGINTTLRYRANFDKDDAGNPQTNDDNEVPVDTTDLTAVDNLAFTRFEAYLGVRWFM